MLTRRSAQVFLNIVLDDAVEEKAGGEKVRIGMVVCFLHLTPLGAFFMWVNAVQQGFRSLLSCPTGSRTYRWG